MEFFLSQYSSERGCDFVSMVVTCKINKKRAENARRLFESVTQHTKN